MKTQEGQVKNNAHASIMELAFAVAVVAILMSGTLNNWMVSQGFQVIERTNFSGMMNIPFPSVVSGLKYFLNSHNI